MDLKRWYEFDNLISSCKQFQVIGPENNKPPLHYCFKLVDALFTYSEHFLTFANVNDATMTTIVTG